MPGWLGAGSPESFIDCIQREEILPCHQTIDYEDPTWKEKWVLQQTGNACAGALILSANMGKSPRDRAFPRMPSDDATVFSSPLEFVKHHRSSKAKSWDEKDQLSRVKALRKVLAKMLK